MHHTRCVHLYCLRSLSPEERKQVLRRSQADDALAMYYTPMQMIGERGMMRSQRIKESHSHTNPEQWQAGERELSGEGGRERILGVPRPHHSLNARKGRQQGTLSLPKCFSLRKTGEPRTGNNCRSRWKRLCPLSVCIGIFFSLHRFPTQKCFVTMATTVMLTCNAWNFRFFASSFRPERVRSSL